MENEESASAVDGVSQQMKTINQLQIKLQQPINYEVEEEQKRNLC
jgi:hypothetical protein